MRTRVRARRRLPADDFVPAPAALPMTQLYMGVVINGLMIGALYALIAVGLKHHLRRYARR